MEVMSLAADIFNKCLWFRLDAVVILHQFPDLGTGSEHALHLKKPTVNIYQQDNVYKCQVFCTTKVSCTDYGRLHHNPRKNKNLASLTSSSLLDHCI